MSAINLYEIEANWNSQIYVWVRPAEGETWKSLHLEGSGRAVREWQPALINGFQDVGQRDWYGTQNDPRKVWLFGESYCYPLEKFELGEQIVAPAPTLENEHSGDVGYGPGR
jgi:hypothetical protein